MTNFHRRFDSQIDGEDFFNFCVLLRKYELYHSLCYAFWLLTSYLQDLASMAILQLLIEIHAIHLTRYFFSCSKKPKINSFKVLSKYPALFGFELIAKLTLLFELLQNLPHVWFWFDLIADLAVNFSLSNKVLSIIMCAFSITM